MRKIIVPFVTILFFVSTVTAFGQSDANLGNTKPGAAAFDTGYPNSNLSQSDLSSAALAPCVLVGTSSYASTAGGFTIWVDITHNPPLLNGTTTNPIIASISWGSGSCTTATTCTLIFQNAPPGPAVVSLNGTSTTDWVDVVATTVVVNKSQTANWFPAASPNSAFTTVRFAATNQWWSPGGNKQASDTYAGPYSTLQWDPGPVTIIYQ